MVLHYLEKFHVPHMLILDADLALVHRERDTIDAMIHMLDATQKDVLLANQDWQKNGGEKRINCGMMFVKNTEFTRTLFQNLVQAHMQGPKYVGPGSACVSDCHCFQTWVKTYPNLEQHLLIASGLKYNRQECTFRCCTACPTNTALDGLNKRPYDDPELDVLHFTSGNSRGAAKKMLQNRTNGKDDVKKFMIERFPDK